ncbi:MAG: hypothetical protein ACI4RA_06695, partial [Kiritimatiellia bacterium]
RHHAVAREGERERAVRRRCEPGRRPCCGDAGGRVEHDFSEAAIAAALAKRLRPDLAKLVQG